MSMQSLNHLVARSIIDPEIVSIFKEGKIGKILSDLEFSSMIRGKLTEIDAGSWADFAVQAYRLVKTEEEEEHKKIVLPSPLEGLTHNTNWTDHEQVA
jgi:hypothetical protein